MKRWSTTVALAVAILAVSGWQPWRSVPANSPGYEQSLVEAGLRPLREAEAAALLGNATVYATYVLTEQKWIQYFDSRGVVVRTPVRDGGPAWIAGRPLLFGTWWGDGEDICFAYGLNRYAECYRLYYRDGSLLYIQTTGSRHVPAGALLAFSTEIHPGNREEFPLVGD